MFDAEMMSQLTALLTVIGIDIVLAGDNAVVVGMAAAGLPKDLRAKAIMIGIIAAMVMRIGFSVVAAEMMGIVGLMAAGGVLLLWVSWKLYREIRESAAERAAAVAYGDDGNLLDEDRRRRPGNIYENTAPGSYPNSGRGSNNVVGQCVGRRWRSKGPHSHPGFWAYFVCRLDGDRRDLDREATEPPRLDCICRAGIDCLCGAPHDLGWRASSRRYSVTLA